VAEPLPASLRSLWPVLLVSGLLQAALGWLLAGAYLTRHNTLAANGRWSSTKTQLERGVLGAFSYVTEPQALAQGHLDLSAWHGYNEVSFARPTAAPSWIEFDFYLARGAYLVALFDRDRNGAATGVRFSGSARFPSAVLEVAADGGFDRRWPLAAPALPRTRQHHARIDLGEREVEVWLDGEPLGRFERPRPRGASFGFRGGLRTAWVDDVAVRLGDGTTLRESFDAPPLAFRLRALAALSTVLLGAALFLLLRRRRGGNDQVLVFQLVLLDFILLVAAAALYFFVLIQSSWYPNLDATLQRAEIYFNKGAGDRVRAEIRSRYADESPEDKLRILFVGSSQTWGAGAALEDETFVARTERLLRARFPAPPLVECINGGISASRAAQLEQVLRGEWLSLRPRIVVIDLSSNDRGVEDDSFAVAIRRMVEESRAAGAVPVLIKEPNAVGTVEPTLLARHRELDEVGRETGTRVLDLHAYLLGFEDSGFLWWDKVHLTSYGQKVMAEKLAADLEPKIVELERHSGDAGGPP